MAAHVMTAAAQMGYVIFREACVRDTGIPLEELDERAAGACAHGAGLAAAPPPDATDGGAASRPCTGTQS
ncbi:hypothetical protein ACFRQM_17130 [Streptomyces sp. NPDC056831]|uniref:hypothetical protein n=1 Tax=Streptomyces sp. NPDC056831 TaxID=3345954 RepID=UPI0036B7254A